MERHLANHLTDEQFTDLLLGTNPAAVQEHLKACSACAEEAERVSVAIGSFQQHSRIWAERRAATRPILVPARPPAFEWLYRPQVWASATLTIAIAVGVGVTANNHRVPVVQPQIATTQSAPVVTPATLKADNDLLSAIDGELRADESTPASAYGLTTAAHEERSRSAKRMINE